MNSLIEKIKKYYSNIFGKFAIMIMGASFFITFIMSFLVKNRLDITLLKSFVAMIIVGMILYLLSIVLKKYLGDIIDTSDNITPTTSFAVDINKNVEPSTNVPTDTPTNTQEEPTEHTEHEEGMESILESDANTTTNDNPIRVEKEDSNTTMRGDIGDIIMNAPSYNDFLSGNYSNTSSVSSSPSSSINSTSSSSSFDAVYTNATDKKTKELNFEKAALEDPDKTAKALRTMMAKDDKNEG